MYTDQEIRAAMGGLVAQKGEDHTSFGRYADERTGKGACFLGALCEYMGKAVPMEGTSARNVLGKGAVSPLMGAAFGVAQMLNDSHFEWKYVLMAVDEVLKVGVVEKGDCPCGCLASPHFNRIVDKVKARRALDRSNLPKVDPYFSNYAQGGTFTPMMADATFNTTASPSAFSVSIENLTTSMDTLAAALNKMNMAYGYVTPKKKDHTLAA